VLVFTDDIGRFCVEEGGTPEDIRDGTTFPDVPTVLARVTFSVLIVTGT